VLGWGEGEGGVSAPPPPPPGRPSACVCLRPCVWLSPQVMCEKCDKKTDAAKGIMLEDLPQILMLQLKRFDFDMVSLRRVKLNDRVRPRGLFFCVCDEECVPWHCAMQWSPWDGVWSGLSTLLLWDAGAAAPELSFPPSRAAQVSFPRWLDMNKYVSGERSLDELAPATPVAGAAASPEDPPPLPSQDAGGLGAPAVSGSDGAGVTAASSGSGGADLEVGTSVPSADAGAAAPASSAGAASAAGASGSAATGTSGGAAGAGSGASTVPAAGAGAGAAGAGTSASGGAGSGAGGASADPGALSAWCLRVASVQAGSPAAELQALLPWRCWVCVCVCPGTWHGSVHPWDVRMRVCLIVCCPRRVRRRRGPCRPGGKGGPPHL
jgi:hypothetical protein